MNKKIATVLLIASIPFVYGCATGVKGSPRRICYESGVQPGSPEFSSCWRNVARSQGTVPFDDPEAIELYRGMIGAATAVGTTSPGAAPPPSSPQQGVKPRSNLGPEYLVTRKAQDIYDVGGTLVQTQFCYVYALSSRAVIVNRKIVFLNENQSCQIK